MKQYVKTFENFFSEPDINITGAPSGQVIKVTLDELQYLISQGIVFSDNQGYTAPYESDSGEATYTFMDENLEKIEEFLHRDVDNDNEAGEDPEHVAKVLGTEPGIDELSETVKSELELFTKHFENMENTQPKKELDKEFMEIAADFGPVYKLRVSMAKYLKMTNQGFSLYCFDKDDNVLKLNEVKGRESTIPKKVAYWMKPEVVEKFNKLGEHVENIIRLKRELFKTTIHHVALGNKESIEPMFSLYNRFEKDEPKQ